MKTASRRRAARSAPPAEFQQFQAAFTRHIRDPQAAPRPAGVPARGMRVYNELVFNNLLSFVSACFPVARALLGIRKWKSLAREFLAQHRAHSPYFRQIPEEFLRFMAQRPPQPEEPDFLNWLLHYEWVELALDTSNRVASLDGIDAEGDLLERVPVLNPVHMLLAYPYAVQRISRRYRPRPDQRETTHLLVFRDLSDRVRFVVLNPVSARLVALLEPGKLNGRQVIEGIVAETRHPDPRVVLAGGRQILERLRNEGAILGTQRRGTRSRRPDRAGR
jgi:uncharacterized protein